MGEGVGSPVPTPEIGTRRLLLRPLNAADAPAIQRLFPRWEVVRFLNAKVPWPYPDDGAEAFVREVVLPAVRQGIVWHWTLRLREKPSELIGGIELGTAGLDHRGFWLAPEWWGQGLMGEASEAATDFWFDALGQEVLRTSKAIPNAASRRISEREGMRPTWIGERNYVSGRHPAEGWEITADEWRARRPMRQRGVDTLASGGGLSRQGMDGR